LTAVGIKKHMEYLNFLFNKIMEYQNSFS
jgi:hypothetical protein